MEMPTKTDLSTTLELNIRSCHVDKDFLRKILNKLNEYSQTALEQELKHFNVVKEDNIAPEKESTIVDFIRNSFVIRVRITSDDGQSLMGTIDEVFNSPNFPDHIETLVIDSSLDYKINNKLPINYFELYFDFSKPKLKDFSINPAQPTPNSSQFRVTGHDSTWANGLFNEFTNLLNKRKTSLPWIHKEHVYDFLLWPIGFPIGFWACYRASTTIKKLFENTSIVVQSAAYVYIFLFSLYIFQLLFRYSRWIWPSVEYRSKNDHASKHRATWTIIIIGLLTGIIRDIVIALSK